MGGQEVNLISLACKVAAWRAFLLLSCVTVGAICLLVDWRGSSIEFQTWMKESNCQSTGTGCSLVHHISAATSESLQERAPQILHNYADEELIDRALQMEVQLNLQAEGLFNASHYHPVKWNSETRSSSSKIAFMFLTVTDLPLEPLWKKFFLGHEKLYNIYVHSDPSWVRDNGSQERLGLFWGRTVPSAASQRSNPNIVAAERRLIANALLDDPSNEWFVLISQSCIPLRNFDYIYQALNATSDVRIDCGKGAPGPMMMSRYLARGETAMLPEVPFSEFRLGLQFFAIRRRHALMIMQDKKYWPKFKLPCIRIPTGCHPDEHYVQTVIGNLDEPACQGTPTFISWNGTKGGHPHSFAREEITPHLIEAMKATQNSRFLFARKFGRDALVPLLALSDLLFK